MKKHILFLILTPLILGCNFKPGGDRATTSSDKMFKIKLRPHSGTGYDYKVSNNTETTFEVNDQSIENKNKSDYLVNYLISKDTAGHLTIQIRYKKIHIYSNINGVKTDLDAENKSSSTDQTENLLAELTKTTITVTLNPNDEVSSIKGYEQIADDYFSHANVDLNTKLASEKQWKQLVENRLVKKSLENLFQILPDSAIHIGDRWKIEEPRKRRYKFCSEK